MVVKGCIKVAVGIFARIASLIVRCVWRAIRRYGSVVPQKSSGGMATFPAFTRCPRHPAVRFVFVQVSDRRQHQLSFVGSIRFEAFYHAESTPENRSRKALLRPHNHGVGSAGNGRRHQSARDLSRHDLLTRRTVARAASQRLKLRAQISC